MHLEIQTGADMKHAAKSNDSLKCMARLPALANSRLADQPELEHRGVSLTVESSSIHYAFTTVHNT